MERTESFGAEEVSMSSGQRIRRAQAGRNRGFTLVEVMAALGLLFIGSLGLLGMTEQAIVNNRQNAQKTLTSIALQDRISGFYRLPRQYLESRLPSGATAFTCGTDANPLGVDTVLLGSIVEDLNLQSDGSALPAGQYGYPYKLTMKVYGVCTPDRKDEQGGIRCVADTTGAAFRGSCPVGQRQIGGMQRNNNTPNTYSVQYTLADQFTGKDVAGGEFWMSDDPTRL